MTSTEHELNVYECRACGELQLSHDEPSCCDHSMEVMDPVSIKSPEAEQIMHEIFGMTETELAICHCVMAEEEMTIDELASRLDRDRSVISRHVNHLTEIGLVNKKSRVLPEGGRINVYFPVSEDVVRRQLKLGVYSWLIEAVELVDMVSEDKIEAMAKRQIDDDDDTGLPLVSRIFYRSRSS